MSVNNESIVKNIEAIAGLPSTTTYPVIDKLANDLRPLHVQTKQKIDKSANQAQWSDIGELDTLNKKREFIKAAVHLNPEDAYKLIRLNGKQPPDSVHRMQKTDPNWVGDLFSANMLIHSLKESGVDISNQKVLDLGCSSGSLVRVLAAYEKSWQMHGCDPIDSAIEWAKENIDTCEFSNMSNDPPLPYADNSFDGVCAISVWSHHSADAAKVWIDEVARVMAPGGWFALSFSTLHHVRWRAKNNRISGNQAAQMLENFAKTGNHFVPVNYDGEDNETESNWGQSAYSRERFFSMFHDDFDVLGYFPGLNQGNQDFAVFGRR